MDFGFGSVTPQPSQRVIFSAATYLDSTSEDSSPDSPPRMNQTVLQNFPAQQYDMLHYNITPSNLFSPQPNPISVEDVYASLLFSERSTSKRRRSGSISTPIPGRTQQDSNDVNSRRRAQNRASQRAFRERKDKHVKGLEYQLEILHEKHQDLLQSYNQQTDKVSMLSNKIGELRTELKSLRNSKECRSIPMCYETRQPPGDFDNFDEFFAQPSTESTSSMECYEPESYFDKHPFPSMDAECAFSTFEDYL